MPKKCQKMTVGRALAIKAELTGNGVTTIDKKTTF